MKSGRYTATIPYQGAESYVVANSGATHAYKGAAYQCAHSQRGYLFQFGSFGARNHWDAANSTCCNQPVANFYNTPQWKGSIGPLRSTDCADVARAAGDCARLVVSVSPGGTECASGSANTAIAVGATCGVRCPEISGIISGGQVSLAKGTLRTEGSTPGGSWRGSYVFDSTVPAAWWAGCSGSGEVTDAVCGWPIRRTYLGGLDYPGGCGCDCCGISGVMAYPSSVVGCSGSGTATWGNTWGVGTVTANPACSGGTISGSWSGSGSAAWSGVTMTSGAAYLSDGTTRSVSGYAGTIGSSGNSACCGGRAVFSGYNGCGSGYSGSSVIARKVGTLAFLPASGTPLVELAEQRISGSGGCSYTTGAALTISTNCLSNTTYTALSGGDGYLWRGILNALRFSNTIPCNNCCGSGTVMASYSDGCSGVSLSGVWPVRRAASLGTTVIGKLVKCVQVWSGAYRYYPVHWELRCNGTSGASGWFGSYYLTWAECTASISGTASANLKALCGGFASGTTCCAGFWNTLYSGSFEARLRVVYGAMCCSGSGPAFAGWLYSGSNNCCTGSNV